MPAVSAPELVSVLSGCGTVLLTGPLEPDGDSIGACLALQRVLRAQSASAKVDVAGVPGWRYDGLPGASAMIADAAVGNYDAVVVLDGDRHRLLPNVRRAFAEAPVRGIVDHHVSTTADGYTHWWLSPHATSTCEMVHDAMVALGMPLDRDLATLLYVGTIFDTGGFRYSNTTPATHRLAAALLEHGIDHASLCARILMERREPGMRLASRVFADARIELDGRLVVGSIPHGLWCELGLVGGDVEGIVDALVHLQGADVGVLLIGREDGSTKLSLRSRGSVNVAAVAKSLSASGGGHAKAAGASVAVGIEAAHSKVAEAVKAALVR
jgi:phosphoesterase RecJ-like protein